MKIRIQININRKMEEKIRHTERERSVKTKYESKIVAELATILYFF